MKLKTLLILAAAALAGCASDKKKTEMTFEELPLAVRLGIEKAYPDARVTEVEKEVHKEDRTVHYEVELVTTDGEEKEARFLPDGELMLRK